MQDVQKYQEKVKKKTGDISAFKTNSVNIDFFVFYCVDNSTIRAFGKAASIYSPLSLFRSWAYSYLAEKSTVARIERQVDFSIIHGHARESLIRYWKRYEKHNSLSYHQANKLIDLFFKLMPCCNLFSKSARTHIFANANVPLDKYSLLHLKEHSDACKDIPSNVSMGFIDTPSKYERFQSEIGRLCGRYPKIVFDIIAQRETNKFALKKKNRNG